jgi:hypothetical protein
LGGAMNVRQLLFRPTRSLYRTRVRESIFAEHQRPLVAAFMECVDFMPPRWPSRISTSNSIFCRSFRFGTRNPWGDIVVPHLPSLVPCVCIVGKSYKWLSGVNGSSAENGEPFDHRAHTEPLANRFLSAIAVHSSALLVYDKFR